MSSSEDAPLVPDQSACPTCKAVFRGSFRRCPNDGALLIAGAADPLVGEYLAGRYLIEAIIGDGGLARVYRARHARMSRRFAIKVPFGEIGYDRKARARLANEAEAASRLDHPNVIGVVDVGETTEGLFFLAMDLADGPSLAHLLARGPIAPAEAFGLFAQLTAGLAHAHERGLVHRDLKPDNVIVSTGADGAPLVQVIDFGLALLDDDGPRVRLTTEGLVVGTPFYMAPEQATDEVLDARTDLFALGIMLFELLAGVLPFDGGPTEVARQNVAAPLPSIRARAGREVEPVAEALVVWLTRKRAAERPSRTADVLAIATRLAAGDVAGARALLPPAFRPVGLAPVDAAPLAPIPAPPPGRRRGRLALIAAAIGGLAAVALVDRCGHGVPERAAAAPPPIDAGALALALGPADAGAADAEFVDAAAAAASARPAPVDAHPGPARPPRQPHDPPRPIPPPPSSSPSPAPVDAGLPPPSVDVGGMSLKALYAHVAQVLDAAVTRLGADRTDALRRRFEAVPPYLEATRKPELKAQAMTELQALARDLARLPR
jgi:serine/threonine-protein kinase